MTEGGPFAQQDDAFMAAALAFGRRNMGRTGPNPAVGALIVKDGVVIARGATAVGGRPHAEAVAVAAAGEAARGATLYATLEPCSHHGATPPCVDAIIGAGIARVVSALEDPDARVAGRGHARLREAGIEVAVGVRAREARADHLGHILRVTQGRPLVTLKLAQTADGYAAGAEHDPRLFITGAVADAATHIERALHGAIMIGAGTASVDDPLLTVRLPGLEGVKPLRVVLDAGLRLSRRSRLAATARETPTLVIAGEKVAEAAAAEFFDATAIEVARVAQEASGRLVLSAALAELAARGVTRVFSEGGPRVAESLLLGALADEVVLHTGRKPLGRPGRLALSPAARARLEDRAAYRLADEAMLGSDHMTRYERIG
ncbi:MULTISPECIES: bifunctional diaminohydroxyphosphoribosylaminopyrimidine deaminase/5-amino-6-(5-phosphoribosylamino)uracil reductase RibD [Methylosinus]|uniref:Riboflavin biosynthesis protein RibD n=1 Tax=Methylosinus trichosporium (strain ATCC 35070 / NCIMB 11131 / UNIQEM 75 / OB3b) TaxID=595536 RepID=A0A2D2D4A8_METT3|nr:MULTISPECIES: bifunctional diaminohydroxyphosphoribosylaminopyrimidine deaminase/5-amino-6-(5-phosphoribosylamino)uracil reductase RibD [Methylosinus]ATQ69827.1 riboflavin biosynthesis protein RibD [Methylosinus trichosporium OB3b]OBS52375.1 riboflavin biosynthesis protein RibD [Methylosinus sp. 3S-1]